MALKAQLRLSFSRQQATQICSAVLLSPIDTKTSIIASLRQKVRHGGCPASQDSAYGGIRRAEQKTQNPEVSIPHSTGQTDFSEAGTVSGYNTTLALG